MSKEELDGEWLDALKHEDEGDEDEQAPEEPDTGDDAGDDGGDDNSAPSDEGTDGDDNEVDEEGSDEGSSDSDEQSGDGKESGDGDDKAGEGDDTGEQSEGEEKPAEPVKDDSTKEAIREAMRELDSEKSQQSERRDSFKKEIVETFYPNGIDRVLRDSEGDPINGIDDLTKLVNPKTEDYFTEEEAGAWLLNAQQQLNRDVQEVERFVEDVADTNVQIEDGAKRVAEKYGDILSSDDKLRGRLLEAYNKTLIKDPKSGVAIKAPMEVEEFFDIALEPILEQRTEAAQKAAAEKKAANEAAKKAQKAAQGERGDLPPSGKAEQLAPADKEWANALKEYEEGAL